MPSASKTPIANVIKTIKSSDSRAYSSLLVCDVTKTAANQEPKLIALLSPKSLRYGTKTMQSTSSYIKRVALVKNVALQHLGPKKKQNYGINAAGRRLHTYNFKSVAFVRHNSNPLTILLWRQLHFKVLFGSQKMRLSQCFLLIVNLVHGICTVTTLLELWLMKFAVSQRVLSSDESYMELVGISPMVLTECFGAQGQKCLDCSDTKERRSTFSQQTLVWSTE